MIGPRTITTALANQAVRTMRFSFDTVFHWDCFARFLGFWRLEARSGAVKQNTYGRCRKKRHGFMIQDWENEAFMSSLMNYET